MPPMMCRHVIFLLILQYTFAHTNITQLNTKCSNTYQTWEAPTPLISSSPRTTGPPPRRWSCRTQRSRASVAAPDSHQGITNLIEFWVRLPSHSLPIFLRHGFVVLSSKERVFKAFPINPFDFKHKEKRESLYLLCLQKSSKLLKQAH